MAGETRLLHSRFAPSQKNPVFTSLQDSKSRQRKCSNHITLRKHIIITLHNVIILVILTTQLLHPSSACAYFLLLFHCTTIAIAIAFFMRIVSSFIVLPESSKFLDEIEKKTRGLKGHYGIHTHSISPNEEYISQFRLRLDWKDWRASLEETGGIGTG